MLRVLVREQISLCRVQGRKCRQESWDQHDTEVEMLTRAPGTETSGGLLSTGVLLMCVYFDPCCGVMLRLFWTEAKLLTVSGTPAPMWGRSLEEGLFFWWSNKKSFPPNCLSNPAESWRRKSCGEDFMVCLLSVFQRETQNAAEKQRQKKT